jgi:O-antigen ligase
MGESLYFGLMQESILPRLRGLASSPNEYVPWALFFLVYFMYFKSFKLVLFTFVTIILSFSTTGMLIAMILLLIYYNNKITFKGILLLFILLVISISVYYLYIDTNKDIMDMIQWRMERNKSGTGRFELWVYALDLINQNIWGYGINQTRILIHDFHALNSVHNSIIEVFLTGGFIGLYLYLLFSIILLLQSIMIWKNNKDSKILLFYIIFILIGMANNTLHIVYVIFYLAILSRYSILQGEQVHAK